MGYLPIKHITATIYIPTSNLDTVTEGAQPIAKVEGVKFIKYKNGKVVYKLGSGSYDFRSQIEKERQSIEW